MMSTRIEPAPVLEDFAQPVQAVAAPPRRRVRPDLSVCYHCASTDTMEPFTRSERVFLLSFLIPGLRRRYCRACTRHFLVFSRG